MICIANPQYIPRSGDTADPELQISSRADTHGTADPELQSSRTRPKMQEHLETLVTPLVVRNPNHAIPLQFLVADPPARSFQGWWLYDNSFQLPVKLENKCVNINLMLLMTANYMKTFNCVWATIQKALADRIVVSIDKAALTEIENTYLNIGAGERVHGKGAARLQVKDLVLAFMAYHESMHEPCKNAFNTVHVRNRKMFKAGMSYPDLLLLFATNPVQKPDMRIFKKVKDVKRVKLNNSTRIRGISVADVRLFEERYEIFSKARLRINTVSFIKNTIDSYLKRNHAYTALVTNNQVPAFDPYLTIVTMARNHSDNQRAIYSRTSSLIDKAIVNYDESKRRDRRRKVDSDDEGFSDDDDSSDEDTARRHHPTLRPTDARQWSAVARSAALVSSASCARKVGKSTWRAFLVRSSRQLGIG